MRSHPCWWGSPANGSTGIAISNVTRTWFHGVYLQDDWKATRKLTVNLGLRWEVQRPVTDRYNRQASFNYNAVNPISAAVGQNYLGELVFATSGNRGLYQYQLQELRPANRIRLSTNAEAGDAGRLWHLLSTQLSRDWSSARIQL